VKRHSDLVEPWMLRKDQSRNPKSGDEGGDRKVVEVGIGSLWQTVNVE